MKKLETNLETPYTSRVKHLSRIFKNRTAGIVIIIKTLIKNN